MQYPSFGGTEGGLTGNRIKKAVVSPNNDEGITAYATTYYTRDAQGNVLAVYDHKYTEGLESPTDNAEFLLSEVPLYRSEEHV